MGKSNFFNLLDQLIFNKIDTLKSDPNYSKINDYLITLDEKQQRAFSQAAALITILIPVLVVAVFFFMNYQTKKDISIKEQIIEQIAEFDSSNNSLNYLTTSIISPMAITTENELDNKIRNILSQNGIAQTKVSISDFNPISTTENITKFSATLNITRFANQDFSKFMKAISDREKMKILDANLQKDNETNLLTGSLNIMHIGKNNNAVEQE